MTKYQVVFELFRKLHPQIYASQFMTSIIPLPFVLLYLESVERKGFEYLENEKRILDKIKKPFHSF